MYIGNDINDFFAMSEKDFPEIEKRIIEISNFICKKNGGEGIQVSLFKIDLIDLLYTNSGP